MFKVNRNPSARELRTFALGLLIGFPVLSLLVSYFSYIRRGLDRPTPLALGIIIGLLAVGIVGGMVALASPAWGRKLYVAWMSVTVPIGILMSTLLLTALYYLLLPVFSLIVRRHDPLRKKPGGGSYWEDYKRHEPTLERMRRPF